MTGQGDNAVRTRAKLSGSLVHAVARTQVDDVAGVIGHRPADGMGLEGLPIGKHTVHPAGLIGGTLVLPVKAVLLVVGPAHLVQLHPGPAGARGHQRRHGAFARAHGANEHDGFVHASCLLLVVP